MSVTIISKHPSPNIEHVIEVLHDGARWRWTRYRRYDNSFDDQFEKVEHSNRPMLFIPKGPDVDAVAVRDLTQKALAQQPPPRENKPDVNALWQEQLAIRRAEHKGQRHFRGATRGKHTQRA